MHTFLLEAVDVGEGRPRPRPLFALAPRTYELLCNPHLSIDSKEKCQATSGKEG